MALNDMFADMLKKAIPPEVAALLTEEKIKEFGAKVTEFVAELRGRLEAIEQTQATILEKLNDNGSNSADGTGSANPRVRRSRSGSSNK